MKQLSTTIFNGVLSVASGGTNSNTASKALVALGAQPALVTNSNIASINGTPLLGSGNITLVDLQGTTTYTSNYTAIANDLVRCNSAAGSFTITLPLSPVDGDIIGFSDVTGSFNTYPVFVSPNGKTIENDTSLVLNIPYVKFSIIYNSANTNWKVLGTGGATTDIRIGEPGPPTAVSAAVAFLTVTITGTPPSVPSGIPITGYTVTSSPLGLSGSGASFPIILTATTAQGIANTAFTFTVTATNAAGKSVPSSATGSITLSLPPAPTVEYIVVGGGGQGGSGAYHGAGGGGGGYLGGSSYPVSTGTTYTATVGGAAYSSGQSSSWGITGYLITAIGGGAGGKQGTDGSNGASGGGGGGNPSSGASSPGTASGTTTSGNNITGGSGYQGGYGSNGSPYYGAGGGGGAGGFGGGGSSYSGGDGGSGVSTWIGTVCGGGGGSAYTAMGGAGGAGGGGRGSYAPTATFPNGQSGGGGLPGTTNTGGGGGGAERENTTQGYGASGLVAVRYPNSYRTATTTGSPTFTDDGTYKIYKFTGSGTISF